MKKLMVLLLAGLSLPSAFAKSETVKLVVHVEGIKKVEPKNGETPKDQLLVSLFDQEEGFPRHKEKATAERIEKVTGDKMDIVFDGLSSGEHAVAVIHDENANGKVDLKYIIVPVGLAEGYGASNDAKGAFGPPKFADAKFHVTGPKTEVTIKLNY